MCFLPALVFSTPDPVDLDASLDAFRPFSSFSVVLSNLLNVLRTMLVHILLGAFFALVEMAISHSGVLVKLRKWLDGLAFKTQLFYGGLLKNQSPFYQF